MTAVTTQLLIDVAGHPAPKGSKKCVGQRGKAKHVLVEMSPLLPAWTETAVTVARARMRLTSWATVHGACSVEIWAWFPRPKTVDRPLPTTRGVGDIDKIARALLDAITTAGVIADDSLVTDLHVHERYALATCGARIVVTPIAPEQPELAL